jgi:PAS domain S-box-containing protein
VDDSTRVQLAHSLRERQGSIAETWYTAIARTSFAPFSPVELRQRLFEVTGQAIELLLAEPFEPDRAAQIGASLAGLHYTQPEALGRTQGVLTRELLSDLSAEQVVALGPNVAALLEGVAIGFARQSTRIQLLEQEAIRSALVSELRATERELRTARDHLEEEVAKRTEELRESEERWRVLVSNSPDPVITVNREGRVLFVNYLRPESGLTPDDVLGRRALDMALPEHEEGAEAVLSRVFETGESVVHEIPVLRPGGAVVWYATHVGPIWRDGQVVAAMIVARDINERKKTEEALLESEERWRTLVTSAPDVIFTLAPGGRIVFVNHFPADSPFDPREVIGRHLHELTVPEQVEAGRAAIQHVFDTGLGCRLLVRVPRASGRQQWYAAVVGPLWHHGAVASAIVIARDITEQRKTEEMKDNLLRDVSHELRTPLARTQISLELLLERIEGKPIDRHGAVKYGRMALDNVQWLAQTVEVILDLSRLEAGVGAFARETIRLADLIVAAVGDMEPLASDKGLILLTDVAEDLPPVQGDREKLARVLRNLIDNAIKFSSSGTIVVSTRRKQENIEVSVSDEGCGIRPDNLARVFDRFFRESTENPGVGVGLPMCKTIVEAHNGRIWAESAGKGRGATLRFTLPTLKNAGESPGDPEKAEDHEQ